MPHGDRPTVGGQGLYRLKPASQRLVEPSPTRSPRDGSRRTRISAAAVVTAAIGGACLAGSTAVAERCSSSSRSWRPPG